MRQQHLELLEVHGAGDAHHLPLPISHGRYAHRETSGRGLPGWGRGLLDERSGLSGERRGLSGERRGLLGERRGLLDERRGLLREGLQRRHADGETS